MERPVYLFWSSDVTEEEVGLIIQTLRGASRTLSIPEFPLEIFGEWYQSDEPHQSLQWYEERAWLPEREQLDGDQLLLDFEREPWKKTKQHLDFAVFGRDMTARGGGDWLSFIFGLGKGDVAISTYRFNRFARNRHDRNLCIQRTIFHELSHALGLLSRWRITNTENRFGKHCTNLCVMRQGTSVQEWTRHAREESNAAITLCPECQDDLRRLNPRVRVVSTRR